MITAADPEETNAPGSPVATVTQVWRDPRPIPTLGEELGRIFEEAGTRGWSATELAPSTVDDYAAELTALTEAITEHRRAEISCPPTQDLVELHRTLYGKTMDLIERLFRVIARG